MSAVVFLKAHDKELEWYYLSDFQSGLHLAQGGRTEKMGFQGFH